ncbi:hypothetical protein AB0I28_37585 [Phytomonospora sp. NPDC050363]|uniref:hypothetical protein n=1 Tax=Phytomonospora sp. NPDC050363 TaxID=3155642 RepID=UPI0033F868E4
MWGIQPPGGVQTTTIGERFSPDFFHTGRLDVVLKAMRMRANDVNRWKLMSALLDPAFDLAGAIGIGDQYVVSSVKDPLGFASCFPTAEHLFPVLAGVNAPNAAFCGQSNALMALPDGTTFRAEVGRLIARIQAYELAGTEVVCRVEFAGHGFILVLRHPVAGQAPMQIELIESLAHSSAIHDCLQNDPFDTGEACTSLQRMASERYRTRKRGARFFGWRAKAIFLHDAGDPDEEDYPLSSYDGEANAANGEYFPCTKMKWWCHPLAGNGLQTWWTMAENRLTALETAFPAPVQGGRAPKRQKT